MADDELEKIKIRIIFSKQTMQTFKERCVFKNGPNSLQTVNSPLFFREIVRIEHLPLRSGRRDSSKREFSGSYEKPYALSNILITGRVYSYFVHFHTS